MIVVDAGPAMMLAQSITFIPSSMPYGPFRL
jgi:hypothetical protein